MNVAARSTINGLALCAGVGMLDEGVAAALRYLGFEYRTVCYVERDSYAAAALVARMESKALDQAAVWDDLKTFPGRAFRGRIHSIAAGFPCQDLSVAGKQAGLDGERSGLFFDILDIADDCEAQILFLENVAGITSATASVVHEAEELDERAAARVVGILADRGWNAEWLHLRATGVGASHERERWFCFAWRRLANAENADWWRELQQRGSPEHWRPRSSGSRGKVAYTRLQQQQLQQRHQGAEHSRSGPEMGNTDGCGRRPQSDAQHENGIVAASGELADAEQPGLQERRRESGNQRKEFQTPERGSASLFAPGPGDWDTWGRIITDGESDPRAPAIKPGVCRVVNGMAYRVDEHRADRLRCGGNGVVALQAAAAFVELIRRARQ